MMLTEQQIKHLVDRFLGWRLPDNFSPDAGIKFDPIFNKGTPYESRHEPSGTNLLDATQADAMVRYMLDGMPEAPRPDGAPDLTSEAIQAAEKFSDVIHMMEARGVNLTRAEDKAWERATAELERIRAKP